MCVHGLVYDMTVSAAKAAALGRVQSFDRPRRAGSQSAIWRNSGRSGRISSCSRRHGLRRAETALYNAELLAKSNVGAPVLYAGNVQNQSAVKEIFESAGIPVYLTENVYPRLDALNIEPVRKGIHAAFEQHIVSAPGMEHIRDLVTGTILPTPGAVMEAAMLLYEEIGDLLVLDIGGATTDVHSVTNGSEEIAALLTAPEPFNKRTVEGDLGLYVNARRLIEMIGEEKLSRELGLDIPAVMREYKPSPETKEQFLLTNRLCLEAGLAAIARHAGRLRIFTRRRAGDAAEGKDLTLVKTLIGTGGALTVCRSAADCACARGLQSGRNVLYPSRA
jgi:uncharacterized protein (TIGR01319 family)